jgi:hypothetical protein
MLRTLLIGWVVFMGISSHGGAACPQAAHPDEPADYTMNERFSVRHSLESLATLQSALDSFKKLTAAAAKTMPKEKLVEVGNTGWEMQNLGFVNHVQAIKGTLLKQESLLKKLSYELAQRKSKSGEINSKELSKSKSAYEEAEKEFQKFWKTFGIAD